MSLDSMGPGSTMPPGTRMTHSLSTPSGVDGTPSTPHHRGGKKLAIRIQMLDDSVTMFQVQVSETIHIYNGEPSCVICFRLNSIGLLIMNKTIFWFFSPSILRIYIPLISVSLSSGFMCSLLILICLTLMSGNVLESI